MKIATYTGSLLLLMMWLSLLPPSNNPIIDDHIIYILALFVLKILRQEKFLALEKFGHKALS